jgi:hypothetical protein
MYIYSVCTSPGPPDGPEPQADVHPAVPVAVPVDAVQRHRQQSLDLRAVLLVLRPQKVNILGPVFSIVTIAKYDLIEEVFLLVFASGNVAHEHAEQVFAVDSFRFKGAFPLSELKNTHIGETCKCE